MAIEETHYFVQTNLIKKDKKINESREFFEQLISEYPTCGRVWKIYIEQEVVILKLIFINIIIISRMPINNPLKCEILNNKLKYLKIILFRNSNEDKIEHFCQNKNYFKPKNFF